MLPARLCNPDADNKMPMDRALYIFFVEHVFLLFLCMEGTYGPPPPPRRSSSSSNRSRMPHTLAFWRMVE